MSTYEKMATTGAVTLRKQFSIRLIASYILDWIILVAIAICSYVLGNIKPNFRNFSLADPNIAYVLYRMRKDAKEKKTYKIANKHTASRSPNTKPFPTSSSLFSAVLFLPWWSSSLP